MKVYLKKLISRYGLNFLYLSCTLILCIVFATVLGSRSEYTFIVNLGLMATTVYLIYQRIFNGRRGLWLKFLCVFALVIASNHLYSYSSLLYSFPWLNYIDRGVLWLLGGIFLCFIILVLLIFRYVLPLQKQGSNSPSKTVESQDTTSNINSKVENNIKNTMLFSRTKFFSVLRVLGIIAIIIVIFAVSIGLYFKFDFPALVSNSTYADLSLLMSSLIGFGATILFLVFFIAIIALLLIELARFLYGRIILFRIDKKNTVNKNNTLTYVFSFLIVFAMLFLAYRISDFTLEGFVEIVAGGDYLAMPLIVLVGIVSFILLIRLTHGILLLVMKSEPIDVNKFVKESGQKLNLKNRIEAISKSIVNIILDTLEISLEFVKFIPSFFIAMKMMVLGSEEDNNDEILDEDYDG